VATTLLQEDIRMHTSILLLALAGTTAPAAESAKSPSWMRDYGTAYAKAQKEGKPLAVIFGSGKDGWNQLSTEGSLGREADRLLGSHFVALYLDTSQKSGRKWADAFGVPDGPGLIISDGSGESMALRYSGQLQPADLHRALRKYSSPDRVARTTDTNPNEEVQYYPPAQPVQAVAPAFVPSFGGFGGFGGGGGGC
jgi:hypothetical protein